MTFVITLGLHMGCIGGFFTAGIFGNFYTKRGGIFDFQNGNSRWPCSTGALKTIASLQRRTHRATVGRSSPQSTTRKNFKRINTENVKNAIFVELLSVFGLFFVIFRNFPQRVITVPKMPERSPINFNSTRTSDSDKTGR